MKALAKRGPQAAAIKGYTKLFQSYKSGVITSDECGTKVDHTIIIYGYDISPGNNHFLIKNSWGTKWGEQGYGRIKISDAGDGKGICGV